MVDLSFLDKAYEEEAVGTETVPAASSIAGTEIDTSFLDQDYESELNNPAATPTAEQQAKPQEKTSPKDIDKNLVRDIYSQGAALVGGLAGSAATIARGAGEAFANVAFTPMAGTPQKTADELNAAKNLIKSGTDKAATAVAKAGVAISPTKMVEKNVDDRMAKASADIESGKVGIGTNFNLSSVAVDLNNQLNLASQAKNAKAYDAIKAKIDKNNDMIQKVTVAMFGEDALDKDGNLKGGLQRFGDGIMKMDPVAIALETAWQSSGMVGGMAKDLATTGVLGKTVAATSKLAPAIKAATEMKSLGYWTGISGGSVVEQNVQAFKDAGLTTEQAIEKAAPIAAIAAIPMGLSEKFEVDLVKRFPSLSENPTLLLKVRNAVMKKMVFDAGGQIAQEGVQGVIQETANQYGLKESAEMQGKGYDKLAGLASIAMVGLESALESFVPVGGVSAAHLGTRGTIFGAKKVGEAVNKAMTAKPEKVGDLSAEYEELAKEQGSFNADAEREAIREEIKKENASLTPEEIDAKMREMAPKTAAFADGVMGSQPEMPAKKKIKERISEGGDAVAEAAIAEADADEEAARLAEEHAEAAEPTAAEDAALKEKMKRVSVAIDESEDDAPVAEDGNPKRGPKKPPISPEEVDHPEVYVDPIGGTQAMRRITTTGRPAVDIKASRESILDRGSEVIALFPENRAAEEKDFGSISMVAKNSAAMPKEARDNLLNQMMMYSRSVDPQTNDMPIADADNMTEEQAKYSNIALALEKRVRGQEKRLERLVLAQELALKKGDQKTADEHRLAMSPILIGDKGEPGLYKGGAERKAYIEEQINKATIASDNAKEEYKKARAELRAAKAEGNSALISNKSQYLEGAKLDYRRASIALMAAEALLDEHNIKSTKLEAPLVGSLYQQLYSAYGKSGLNTPRMMASTHAESLVDDFANSEEPARSRFEGAVKALGTALGSSVKEKEAIKILKKHSANPNVTYEEILNSVDESLTSRGKDDEQFGVRRIRAANIIAAAIATIGDVAPTELVDKAKLRATKPMAVVVPEATQPMVIKQYEKAGIPVHKYNPEAKPGEPSHFNEVIKASKAPKVEKVAEAEEPAPEAAETIESIIDAIDSAKEDDTLAHGRFAISAPDGYTPAPGKIPFHEKHFVSVAKSRAGGYAVSIAAPAGTRSMVINRSYMPVHFSTKAAAIKALSAPMPFNTTDGKPQKTVAVTPSKAMVKGKKDAAAAAPAETKAPVAGSTPTNFIPLQDRATGKAPATKAPRVESELEKETVAKKKSESRAKKEGASEAAVDVVAEEASPEAPSVESWTAYRGGVRKDVYSVDDIDSSRKSTTDQGLGIYLTSDKATSDYYAAKIAEGGASLKLKVSVNKDSLIDKNATLSEQTPEVIEGIKKLGLYEGNEDKAGGVVYTALEKEYDKSSGAPALQLKRGANFPAMKYANEKLQSVGIEGFKYMADHIGGKGKKEHYVIFDGSKIENEETKPQITMREVVKMFDLAAESNNSGWSLSEEIRNDSESVVKQFGTSMLPRSSWTASSIVEMALDSGERGGKILSDALSMLGMDLKEFSSLGPIPAVSDSVLKEFVDKKAKKTKSPTQRKATKTSESVVSAVIAEAAPQVFSAESAQAMALSSATDIVEMAAPGAEIPLAEMVVSAEDQDLTTKENFPSAEEIISGVDAVIAEAVAMSEVVEIVAPTEVVAEVTESDLIEAAYEFVDLGIVIDSQWYPSIPSDLDFEAGVDSEGVPLNLEESPEMPGARYWLNEVVVAEGSFSIADFETAMSANSLPSGQTVIVFTTETDVAAEMKSAGITKYASQTHTDTSVPILETIVEAGGKYDELFSDGRVAGQLAGEGVQEAPEEPARREGVGAGLSGEGEATPGNAKELSDANKNALASEAGTKEAEEKNAKENKGKLTKTSGKAPSNTPGRIEKAAREKAAADEAAKLLEEFFLQNRRHVAAALTGSPLGELSAEISDQLSNAERMASLMTSGRPQQVANAALSLRRQTAAVIEAANELLAKAGILERHGDLGASVMAIVNDLFAHRITAVDASLLVIKLLPTTSVSASTMNKIQARITGARKKTASAVAVDILHILEFAGMDKAKLARAAIQAAGTLPALPKQDAAVAEEVIAEETVDAPSPRYTPGTHTLDITKATLNIPVANIRKAIKEMSGIMINRTDIRNGSVKIIIATDYVNPNGDMIHLGEVTDPVSGNKYFSSGAIEKMNDAKKGEPKVIVYVHPSAENIEDVFNTLGHELGGHAVIEAVMNDPPSKRKMMSIFNAYMRADKEQIEKNKANGTKDEFPTWSDSFAEIYADQIGRLGSVEEVEAFMFNEWMASKVGDYFEKKFEGKSAFGRKMVRLLERALAIFEKIAAPILGLGKGRTSNAVNLERLMRSIFFGARVPLRSRTSVSMAKDVSFARTNWTSASGSATLLDTIRKSIARKNSAEFAGHLSQAADAEINGEIISATNGSRGVALEMANYRDNVIETVRPDGTDTQEGIDLKNEAKRDLLKNIKGVESHAAGKVKFLVAMLGHAKAIVEDKAGPGWIVSDAAKQRMIEDISNLEVAKAEYERIALESAGMRRSVARTMSSDEYRLNDVYEHFAIIYNAPMWKNGTAGTQRRRLSYHDAHITGQFSDSMADKCYRVVCDRTESIRRAEKELGYKTGTHDALKLVPSKVKHQVLSFTRAYIEPLQAMYMGVEDVTAFGKWLYARHAEERNDEMARQGKIKNSGMSTIDARKYLKDIKEKDGGETHARYEKMAEIVYEMNQRMLDTAHAGQLIDNETLKMLGKKSEGGIYQYYVPLKGIDPAEMYGYEKTLFDIFDEETAMSHRGGGSGKSLSQKKGVSEEAMGRKSEADPKLIVPNVMAAYFSTVSRAEQNVAMQEFAKMAKDNDEAARKDGLWRYGEQANKFDSEHAKTIWVRVHGEAIPIAIMHSSLARAFTGIGIVHANGMLKFATGFMRYQQMVMTSINPDFLLVNLIRDIETAISTYTMDADTKKNLAGNMKSGAAIARDAFASIPAIEAYQLHGVEGSDWIDKRPWISKEMMNEFDEFVQEGGAVAFNYHKTVEEISDDLAREADRNVKPGAIANIGRMKEQALKMIDAALSSGESAVRFSVYRELRRQVKADGSEVFTKAQAAVIAKGITVDFNQQGELAPLMNALYLFFNAAVQGTTRFYQAIMRGRKQDPSKLKTLGIMLAQLSRAMWPIVAGSFAYNLMMGWMMGDDEDGVNWLDKVSPNDWQTGLIVSSNITKGSIDPEFVKVPVAYGINFFVGMGYLAAKVVRKAAKGQEIPWGEMFLDGVGMFMNAFNPMGGALELGNGGVIDKAIDVSRSVSPYIASLAIQVISNRDSRGIPITKVNQFAGSENVEHTYYSSTPDWAVKVAGMTNKYKYIKGNIGVSPGMIAFMGNIAWGGTGNFAIHSAQYSSDMFSAITMGGKVPSLTKAPLASRFIKRIGMYVSFEKFMANGSETIGSEKELKSIKEDLKNAYIAKKFYNKSEAQNKKVDKNLRAIDARLEGIMKDHGFNFIPVAVEIPSQDPNSKTPTYKYATPASLLKKVSREIQKTREYRNRAIDYGDRESEVAAMKQEASLMAIYNSSVTTARDLYSKLSVEEKRDLMNSIKGMDQLESITNSIIEMNQ